MEGVKLKNRYGSVDEEIEGKYVASRFCIKSIQMSSTAHHHQHLENESDRDVR